MKWKAALATRPLPLPSNGHSIGWSENENTRNAPIWPPERAVLRAALEQELEKLGGDAKDKTGRWPELGGCFFRFAHRWRTRSKTSIPAPNDQPPLIQVEG
jgi:hypothetical protein